jgi:hypothetical protein
LLKLKQLFVDTRRQEIDLTELGGTSLTIVIAMMMLTEKMFKIFLLCVLD